MRALMIVLVVLSFAAIAASFRSQDVAKEAKDRTRLESFSGVRGDVVVRGFSRIGSIQSKYQGRIDVEVKEFTTASTGKREIGLTVESNSGEEYASSTVAFVDFEEIDGVIKGLDYIAKLDRSVTKLSEFQADFHTKGDLTLSTASSGQSILFAVSCGTIGRSQILFDAESIPKFRDILNKAKIRLAELDK